MLQKVKPIEWFLETFTTRYLKQHTFSTIFIYAILVIVLFGFINQFSKFTLGAFGIFILKLIFTIVVICLIKLFFENYNL
ncbi:MAG: hypothetical protein WCX82_03235 [archaeon]|jgi:FtsH-binding integral membrane protein